MDAKNLVRVAVTTAIFALCGTVAANDIHYPEETVIPGAPGQKKTRAEVRAEVAQARAQGLLNENLDLTYPNLPIPHSTRSRAEVREEAIRYVRDHKFNPDYDLD